MQQCYINLFINISDKINSSSLFFPSSPCSSSTSFFSSSSPCGSFAETKVFPNPCLAHCVWKTLVLCLYTMRLYTMCLCTMCLYIVYYVLVLVHHVRNTTAKGLRAPSCQHSSLVPQRFFCQKNFLPKGYFLPNGFLLHRIKKNHLYRCIYHPTLPRYSSQIF